MNRMSRNCEPESSRLESLSLPVTDREAKRLGKGLLNFGRRCGALHCDLAEKDQEAWTALVSGALQRLPAEAPVSVEELVVAMRQEINSLMQASGQRRTR
jgi:hypothetical protein